MAAGAGRRFGFRPKSLLTRDGEPLLERQIRLLTEAGLRQLVVALGHHAEVLRPLLALLQPRLPAGVMLREALNSNPDAGTASSLCTALAALPPATTGVLVVLADQPLLSVSDLRAALAAWATRPAGVDLVLPMHNGQPGHPLVFGPAVRRAIEAGQGRLGVRDWRRAHPERVRALQVDHPRCTQDVDSDADLPLLAREHDVHLRWPPAVPSRESS